MRGFDIVLSHEMQFISAIAAGLALSITFGPRTQKCIFRYHTRYMASTQRLGAFRWDRESSCLFVPASRPRSVETTCTSQRTGCFGGPAAQHQQAQGAVGKNTGRQHE